MPLDRSALAVELAAAFARRLDPDVPPDADHGIDRVADAVAALGATGDDRRLIEAIRDRVAVDVDDGRFTPLPRVIVPPILLRPEAAVVRESDLLVLTVTWRGATARDHVLRPDDGADLSALVVELPFQHLMEKAFQILGPEPPEAHVPLRAARRSRIAFDLPAGEAVPLTAAGVLAAMRRLPPRVALQARPRAEPSLPPWFIPGLVDVLDPVQLAHLDPGEIAGRHRAVRRTLATLGGIAAVAAEPGAQAVLDRLGQRAPGLTAVRGDRPDLGDFRPFEPGIDIVDVLAQIPAEPTATETALELPTRLVLSPSALGGWAHAAEPVAAPDGTVELWHTRLGTRIVAGDGTVTVDEDNGSQRIVRAVWSHDVASGGEFPDMPPADNPWKTSSGPTEVNPFLSSTTAWDRLQIVANCLVDEKGHTPPPVGADALSLTSLGAWTDLHATWNPDHNLVVAWDHRMAGGRDDFVRVVVRGYSGPFGFATIWVTETWREIVAVDDKRGPAAPLRQRTYPLFLETVRRFTGGVTRENPYVEVRVLQARGPDLVNPTGSSLSFVPVDGNGVPWLVPYVGIDADGREHPVPMPLLFVGAPDAVSPASTPHPDPAGVLAPYGIVPQGNGFRLANADDRTFTGRTAGRRIAYAPASAGGDMAHETDAQWFAARLRIRDCDPVLVCADLISPAVAALSGRRDPMRMTYHPGYRSAGFGPGEVVLALTTATSDPPAAPAKPKVTLPGGGESTGGLAVPSFDVGGLSRSHGVVGDPADPVNPAALLGGVMLFGVVPLADLIPHDLLTMPKLVQQVLDAVAAVGHDLHRLVDLGVAEGTSALDQLGAAAAGTSDATTAFTAVQAAVAAARARAGTTSPGLAALLTRIADGVAVVLPTAATLTDLLALVRAGTLPDPSHLRLHLTHSTKLEPFPDAADPLIHDGELLISVDVRGDGDDAPTTEVVAELRNLTLTLVPGGGLQTLVDITLERMLVRMRAGSKPEVDVVIAPPKWRGVLEWVNDVLALVPADGFADPPYVEVDTKGARAGFSLALPDVAMGMFCLTNLAIAAEARVPWVDAAGPSLWFAFCRRDRPFTLAVAFLGGGGYFGIEIGLGGVRTLEASFEVGAVLALDFGVASGSVSCMAGIYFKLSGDQGTILGYVRIRGEVDVLGLISASITLAMELGYDAGKVIGRASITVEVSIAFFSTSVSISCEKKFAGSAGDPTFAELLGPADGPWAGYCAAFAPLGAP